jgi:hypothetical protein
VLRLGHRFEERLVGRGRVERHDNVSALALKRPTAEAHARAFCLHAALYCSKFSWNGLTFLSLSSHWMS